MIPRCTFTNKQCAINKLSAMNRLTLAITVLTLASCSSFKVTENDGVDQAKKKAESGELISCGEVVTLESLF